MPVNDLNNLARRQSNALSVNPATPSGNILQPNQALYAPQAPPPAPAGGPIQEQSQPKSYLVRFMDFANIIPSAQASGFPSPEDVFNDSDFQSLPPIEKVKVMRAVDPDFAALPEAEQTRVFMPGELYQAHTPEQPEQPGLLRQALTAAEPVVRPMLEAGGAVAGGIAGAPVAPPYGTVAGGALGYAGGKRVADIIFETEQEPTTVGAEMAEAAQDVAIGATFEMGGPVAFKFLAQTAKVIGAVGKPFLGKLSGVGAGAIDETLKAAKQSDLSINPLKIKNDFDKALRGKIKPEEIVENVKSSVQILKDKRQAEYLSRLKEVGLVNNPVDVRPISRKLSDLINSYNIKITWSIRNGRPKANIDMSQVGMWRKGRKDIENAINEVLEWKNDTPLGLDALKKRLDDFYSESSQARQFVASLRGTVKDTIVKHVPEYAEMTRGYEEASTLIKDIETGLMTRKKGMTGRIVADQTLRRVMSAMRDNFVLRKDLLDTLGAKTGQSLAAQTAGLTMSQIMPRGLAGTGPVLAAQAAYAHFFNPHFWPVLAASSPRVQAEFLRFYGQMMKAIKMVPPRTIGPAAITLRKEDENG